MNIFSLFGTADSSDEVEVVEEEEESLPNDSPGCSQTSKDDIIVIEDTRERENTTSEPSAIVRAKKSCKGGRRKLKRSSDAVPDEASQRALLYSIAKELAESQTSSSDEPSSKKPRISDEKIVQDKPTVSSEKVSLVKPTVSSEKVSSVKPVVNVKPTVSSEKVSSVKPVVNVKPTVSSEKVSSVKPVVNVKPTVSSEKVSSVKPVVNVKPTVSSEKVSSVKPVASTDKDIDVYLTATADKASADRPAFIVGSSSHTGEKQVANTHGKPTAVEKPISKPSESRSSYTPHKSHIIVL